MSKPIYVIGHCNPDTDSICSAIGYAHLKQALGENAIPARAGKINAETAFVLKHFGFEPPQLVDDLYPRVHDVMSCNYSTVKPWDTVRELGRVMKANNGKSIPVIDNDGMLVGIVTGGDLAKRYFDELEMQDLDKAGVTFAGVMRALDGTLISGQNLDRIVTGKVRIAAADTSTVVNVINTGDIVLVGDREKTQLICIEHGVSCLIITVNAEVSDAVRTAAADRGVIIIKAPYDTYTCARLINQSIPVLMIMQKKVISFKPTELVTDIKTTIVETKYRNYPVVENGKLVGLINRDRLIVPEREKVILVDHNEMAQAVEGIEEAQIIELIDHHRLGGLETSEPIFIRHEPVGSTATIVANMHWHRSIAIPPNIAGLLLAAIISDTVLFKSPTVTAKDRETASKLASIAGLDVTEFGMQVLRAGSQLGDKSVDEIVHQDLKEFQIGEYRVAIGQISVMDPAEVLGIKAEFIAYMEVMRNKKGYDMVLLMVTDIITEATYLLYAGQAAALLAQAFGRSGENGVIYLPGVLSRKKQVVPPMVEVARR